MMYHPTSVRLSYRVAANLFEAAEGVGVQRKDLIEPLGLNSEDLVDPARGIDWDTLVAVLERLSEVLGGEVERLRNVGREMAGVPSFALLQRLGRGVFSLKHLYLIGERWVGTASVPHLVMRTTFPSEDRMCFRCSIPEPYAASAPYLHIFEGLLRAAPTMIGLPAAKILASSVTPRELDITLELPPSRSVFDRVKRAARAAIHHDDAVALLEGQRREIADGLEAAKRSTAEIVTLFDRLPDLVVIHRAGKIVWANRAAVRTLGHEETSDVVGQSLADLFHPSSQTLANDRIHGAADDESAPDLVDAELVAHDGRRLLVEVSPVQTVSFGGKEARLFVAHNVTERKRLQQRLSIADRLAAVGLLAAGIAHEVNNPLAYVLNNIEIARRELGPLGSPAEPSRAALTIALEGVDRIRTIIRDLLALARVEDDAIGSVEAVTVVDSTLALAMPQIAERATLVRDFSPTPPVRGTSSRIGQVLLNLVANALEAMPPSNRARNVLRVAVSARAGGAVIEVSDTGGGIAPQHMARVFEPFFTTKSLGNGTGLGLAISQRLVAEMGGELAFESVEGVGTTFRVTLCYQEEEPPVLGRGHADDPTRSQRGT
jgi:PAS domain S-box-containing protein